MPFRSGPRLIVALLLAATSVTCKAPSAARSDASADPAQPDAVALAAPSATPPRGAPSAAAPHATLAASKATAGEEWRSPTLGVMKWVPPGTFTMGSPPSEPGRYRDESAHPVTLTRGFWMMESELTQGAWSAVMGSNASSPASCGADCPVTDVSWDDAQAFAKRAAERDGVTYRLATEAEWERAARGGEDHLYAGSDSAEAVGWVAGGGLHPVCKLARNGYGLCDMTGNVWEWVADWYGPYATAGSTDPVGAATGSMRVLRGGGTLVARRNLRVARRDETISSARSPFIGFRLVRGAP